MKNGFSMSVALLGGLFVTLLLPGTRAHAQQEPQAAFGGTITVTAPAPRPMAPLPVFLSGTWLIFLGGSQSPGAALGGDLGGTPAPEMNVESPVAHLIAVTGWDVVDEDASHRFCSNNFDDNDRLGTDYGGTNRTRPGHTGVDIQANEGAPVYAWQGGRLGLYPTDACGPNGVRITHLDHGVDLVRRFHWQSR